ncbi:MAG: universal stress protein UspA [Micrococcaceae bacterium]|nr:universal stress protein UspA [Micrococcaceae bacterium]
MDDRGPVVVGVDGSPAAAAALREADLLAARLGSRIDGIACWEVPVLFRGYPVDLRDDDFSQQAKHQLDRTLKDVYDGSIPAFVGGRVVQGGPALVLVRDSKDALMLHWDGAVLAGSWGCC